MNFQAVDDLLFASLISNSSFVKMLFFSKGYLWPVDKIFLLKVAST